VGLQARSSVAQRMRRAVERKIEGPTLEAERDSCQAESDKNSHAGVRRPTRWRIASTDGAIPTPPVMLVTDTVVARF